MKKLCSIIMTLVLVGSLAGCGSSSTKKEEATTPAETEKAAETKTTEDTVYKIGVLQLVQHEALDASNKGFFAALDEAGIKYEADQQNASGDQSSCQTIAESLVNNGNDLILAIATPAAQAVAGATSKIPVVVTAVTDPAASGLVASNEAPGGNVTGTSDLTPVKEQIELLKKVLPDAKTVGILYCTSESNSDIQAAMAEEACTKLGLESKVYTVSSSNEIQQVVESMVGNVDCIYAPTDNTIAAGMTTVAMVANENKLPIICGEGGMVNNGGLCTYGIDYYKLGYLAGQQAVSILKGEATPAETPIGYLSADQCSLTVNEEVAATLGIDVATIK
ncbi:MAG TPA: ABC transporter substrate-binding protein [Lachnospiraceae bacterium]|nr:ABC transporter substrate-binding protein [Lachnospiraceae bacterium]